MKDDLETRLTLLRDVTAKVGDFALSRFHGLEQIAVETKGEADYVSAVDRDAESLARQLIHAQFPADAIVGEEQHGEARDNHWLIDPVDGTANFLSGIPLWAVSIAYIHDNEPVLGAIALPAMDALFWASSKGPLHSTGSVRPLTNTAPLAFGIGRNRVWPFVDRLELEANLEARGFHIVSLGSCAAALAMVAAGRLAGYVEHGTNLWDCAAGHVLCGASNVPSTIRPDANGKVAVVATPQPLIDTSVITGVGAFPSGSR
ncbi:hypothetical protein F9K96_19280 [Brucella anthropi]|uniref:inositol monophosphatase family protein n=1 Tax=Brucella anthropi TaxID=529 RepID=UPI00124F4A81|nr:inositol monophosphatase family protein [Brucella anthropi]KAB2787291.1 hypothetical protein F9K96_19280 [Brucella anthropi]